MLNNHFDNIYRNKNLNILAKYTNDVNIFYYFNNNTVDHYVLSATIEQYDQLEFSAKNFRLYTIQEKIFEKNYKTNNKRLLINVIKKTKCQTNLKEKNIK